MLEDFFGQAADDFFQENPDEDPSNFADSPTNLMNKDQESSTTDADAGPSSLPPPQLRRPVKRRREPSPAPPNRQPAKRRRRACPRPSEDQADSINLPFGLQSRHQPSSSDQQANSRMDNNLPPHEVLYQALAAADLIPVRNAKMNAEFVAGVWLPTATEFEFITVSIQELASNQIIFSNNLSFAIHLFTARLLPPLSSS
jgi:hypothetical protein